MPGVESAEAPMANDPTDDGTITDVPVALRECLVCRSKFFVEAVTGRRAGKSTPHETVYVLRCPKGHLKEWVKGALGLRDPK